MEKLNISDIACQIIAFAGDSKCCAIEAMEAARAGDFDEAERLLEKSGESFDLAHEIHTKVITSEAKGEDVKITMLLMHASNIFTTAEVSRIFAEQYIELCKEIKNGL